MNVPEEIPEGYVHKATSESFNGSEKISILYHVVDDDYLIMINEDGWAVSKTQLELIVHAGNDVLDNLKV